jgi:hypothetical protein
VAQHVASEQAVDHVAVLASINIRVEVGLAQLKKIVRAIAATTTSLNSIPAALEPLLLACISRRLLLLFLNGTAAAPAAAGSELAEAAATAAAATAVCCAWTVRYLCTLSKACCPAPV